MSRLSGSHIAVPFVMGVIVPIQSMDSKPRLADTVGNGAANGLAAIGISDSAAPFATAAAVNGIAIGTEAEAFTMDATHLCGSGNNPPTDCGQNNIAIGASARARNDFALAVGFNSMASDNWSSAYGTDSKASNLHSSAFGVSSSASGNASAAYGDSSKAAGDNNVAFGFSANAVGGSSVAAGASATANGPVSVAIGFVPFAEDAAI